jgi:hypothetical protein
MISYFFSMNAAQHTRNTQVMQTNIREAQNAYRTFEQLRQEWFNSLPRIKGRSIVPMVPLNATPPRHLVKDKT